MRPRPFTCRCTVITCFTGLASGQAGEAVETCSMHKLGRRCLPVGVGGFVPSRQLGSFRSMGVPTAQHVARRPPVATSLQLVRVSWCFLRVTTSSSCQLCRREQGRSMCYVDRTTTTEPQQTQQRFSSQRHCQFRDGRSSWSGPLFFRHQVFAGPSLIPVPLPDPDPNPWIERPPDQSKGRHHSSCRRRVRGKLGLKSNTLTLCTSRPCGRLLPSWVGAR